MQEFVFYGIFFVLLLISYVIFSLWHDPNSSLSQKQKQNIITNGLIHFTSMEFAEKIIADNVLKGSLSKMSKKEEAHGPMVWFYPYCDIKHLEKRHKILNRKRKAKTTQGSYDVCLHITGFSDEILDNFHSGRFGTVYSYYGDLTPERIEITKKW